MKTLLVNLPPKKIVEPDDAPDYPHIGLGYIASCLRSNNCPVEILDSKLERISVSDTLKKIGDIKPDILGLTAFTQEIVHVASFAKEVKNKLPDVRIVIGGIHATALPKKTLEDFSCFDFLVFGEGEITLFELIEALDNGAPLDRIKGLGFRRNGEIYINEQRPWNTELDKLPFPAWDLFPKAELYPIITSRGCPFKCIFCTRPYGNRVRERSPENVVTEFEELNTRYNAKRIVFRDETFGLNKKRALKIADMIVRNNLNKGIKWGMHSRVDTVDFDMLQKFKMAGCVNVGFGVESGNAEILKKTKKGITLEQAQKAVKMAKKAGLGTSSYFILGMPNESPKTAWDTINFARKLNTDSVSIAIMIPFPKTDIAQMVMRGEGGYKQISYRWSDYNKQTGSVVELEGISRRELVFFQITGYLLCYIYNMRFALLYHLVKSRLKQVLLLVRNLFLP